MAEARRDSNPGRYTSRMRKTGRIWLIVFALASIVFAVQSYVGLGKWGDPVRERSTASADVRRIHSVATRHRQTHGDTCVTALELRSEVVNLPVIDPWGTPYAIRCSGEDTTVLSFGADKKDGTADDIRAPQ